MASEKPVTTEEKKRKDQKGLKRELSEGRKQKVAQFDYLDMLASTLTEHENKLNGLIERFDKASGNIIREAGKPQDTLIYIKLRLNCSTEELKTILECLKDHADTTTERAPNPSQNPG